MNQVDIKVAMEERYSDSDITRQNSIIVPIHVLYDTYNNGEQSHIIYFPGGNIQGSHVIIPKMHYHDYIEFMFILDGEINQKIESSSYRYQKGDICLLNRSVRHCEIINDNTDCKVAYLCVSCDYLKSALKNNVLYDWGQKHEYVGSVLYHFLQASVNEQGNPRREYYDITPTMRSESYSEIIRILESISKELRNQVSGSNQRIQSEILQLIYIMEQPQNYHISHRQLDSSTEEFIMSRVINYLSERHGRVSWEEISQRMNYSASYVNQIVKKHTGKSMLQLGKEYCLEEAKRLLRETDMSILGIISKLEYKNSSYFYKLFFEQTGMSPREYRDAHSVSD